jgi:hypothetical protein
LAVALPDADLVPPKEFVFEIHFDGFR